MIPQKNNSNWMISVPVPDHPHLSNLLVRAASDPSFCVRLLADPAATITGFDLPPADRAILSEIQANSLPDFAAKLKAKIFGRPGGDEEAYVPQNSAS